MEVYVTYVGKVFDGSYIPATPGVHSPVTLPKSPFIDPGCSARFWQDDEVVWVQTRDTGWQTWTRYPNLDTAIAATLLGRKS